MELAGRSKVIVFVAAVWFALGIALLYFSIPDLIHALSAPAEESLVGFRVVRTVPDWLGAAIAAAGTIIGSLGLWGAFGLLKGRPRSRGTLEIATWTLIPWLFAALLAANRIWPSALVQFAAVVAAAILAVPVAVLLVVLRSRLLRESSIPA